MSGKGRYAQLTELLTGPLHKQHPARVAEFIAHLEDTPAAAQRVATALQNDDMDTVFRELAESTWGFSAPKAKPAAPVAPNGSRQPLSLEQRVTTDPEIRRTVDAAEVSPELRARINSGDAEAIMEAYRGAAPRRGRKPKDSAQAIRELAKPADQVAAENIGRQFDRAVNPSSIDEPNVNGAGVDEGSWTEWSAPGGPDAPARQMALPFGEQPTGMIPYGTRGPGVPVGGPSGPGVRVDPGTELIPAPPRRIGGQTRELSVPERPYRVVDEAKPKGGVGRPAALAAGAAGLGGAAYYMTRPGERPTAGAEDDAQVLTSGGEADLAEETRPAPKVAATPARPEPTVVQAPTDPSLQARNLINRLNDMRRAAGGEVPEAPAMMREINRLLALGDQVRRATYVAAPQDEAGRLRQQAQGMIDQVNQMYRQGMTPNSPQVQRIMAQVRQLQARADDLRNRRAG